MVCSKCGTQVVTGAQFCTQCGVQLFSAPAAEVPRATPSVVPGGVPTDSEYLEAAIGQKNLDYYLSRFERFASNGGSASWNWPAFFVPLIWMLYRKMWVYALVYLFVLPIASFALFIPLFLVLPPEAAALLGWLLQLAIVFVLIPMYANALYYRTVKARISDAQAYRGDREKQLRMLASQGGTSNAALIVIIVVVVGVVPVIGILAAIAIPAYQDYTLRAQVSEGLNIAAGVKEAVAESFLEAGAVPVDRAEAGMTPDASDTSGKYVRAIEINDGRIDIVYGNEANPALEGKVLSITPYGQLGANDTWTVFWRCGYGSIPEGSTHEISPYEPGTLEPQRLPSACRQ